jgi:hypothetical protein
MRNAVGVVGLVLILTGSVLTVFLVVLGASQPEKWLDKVVGIGTVVFAGVLALITWYAMTVNYRRTQIEFFVEVSRILLKKKNRNAKLRVYSLASARKKFNKWDDADKEAAKELLEKLDVVATMVMARQVSITAVMMMYGDVILRVFYVCAPYIESLVEGRGHHHLLPLRRFIPALHQEWLRLSKPRFWRRAVVWPSFIPFPPPSKPRKARGGAGSNGEPADGSRRWSCKPTPILDVNTYLRSVAMALPVGYVKIRD